MRHIGTIPQLDDAQRFIDYLSAKGISAVTEAQGSEWAIWVRDEDHKQHSQEELMAYLQNVDGESYKSLAAKARQEREAKQQARLVSDKTSSDDKNEETVPAKPLTMRDVAKRAPLTMTLLILCTFTGFASQLGRNIRSSTFESLAFCNPQHLVDPAWQAEKQSTEDIRSGEIWRVVTPAFLHFGIAHLGINLFFLFRVGWMFENRNQTIRMALVLFVCAMVGNLGQFYCERWPLFGGLSGAVSGLVAYIAIRMHVAPKESPRLAPISVLLILLAIGLAVSVDQLDNETIGNDVKIANWSQLFGVIAGSALAIVLPMIKRNDTDAVESAESATESAA